VTGCGCWRCAVEAAADLALDAGGPGWARAGDLFVVADLLIVEGLANGHDELPATTRLVRADGRAVWLFRWPPEAAA
jgi:hypothetical protein